MTRVERAAADAPTGAVTGAQGGYPGLGRVLVVVPTYDEAPTLPTIHARLRAAVPEVDLLVVDDGSPDGTGDIADGLAEHDQQVQVLHHGGKQGLGAAYIAGFDWARSHGYDVVVEMDADGSHAPEQLPRLLSGLRHADLVIGSRWVPGGEVRNWPPLRQLISRTGNTYARLMLRMPLRDSTAGFRAYRMTALGRIALERVSSQGYCFQVDLAWQAWRLGLTVLEVPITFTERTVGRSKMSQAIVVEALWRVTVWGLTHGSRSVRRRSLSRTR